MYAKNVTTNTSVLCCDALKFFLRRVKYARIPGPTFPTPPCSIPRRSSSQSSSSTSSPSSVDPPSALRRVSKTPDPSVLFIGGDRDLDRGRANPYPPPLFVMIVVFPSSPRQGTTTSTRTSQRRSSDDDDAFGFYPLRRRRDSFASISVACTKCMNGFFPFLNNSSRVPLRLFLTNHDPWKEGGRPSFVGIHICVYSHNIK